MEKNQNLNPELEQIREQFRMLTEKVEKQNIVTDQLMREISKSKIFKYQFMRHWGLILIALSMSVYGIYMTFDFGYPFWTSWSFIYMIGLLLWSSYKHHDRQSEYLKSINYDLATFWKRQDEILNKKFTFRSIARPLLELLPIFVHGVFLARYLRSIGEIKIPGDYWWVYLLLSVCVLMISAILLAKPYHRARVEIFRDDENK